MENPAAKCSVLKVVRSPRVELGWVAPLVPKTYPVYFQLLGVFLSFPISLINSSQ